VGSPDHPSCLPAQHHRIVATERRSTSHPAGLWRYLQVGPVLMGCRLLSRNGGWALPLLPWPNCTGCAAPWARTVRYSAHIEGLDHRHCEQLIILILILIVRIDRHRVGLQARHSPTCVCMCPPHSRMTCRAGQGPRKVSWWNDSDVREPGTCIRISIDRIHTHNVLDTEHLSTQNAATRVQAYDMVGSMRGVDAWITMPPDPPSGSDSISRHSCTSVCRNLNSIAHWILGVHHLWFRVQLHSLCTESSVGSLSAASEELQWPAWQLYALAHCTVSTIDILEKGGDFRDTGRRGNSQRVHCVKTGATVHVLPEYKFVPRFQVPHIRVGTA
jgi:hypothetical protein